MTYDSIPPLCLRGGRHGCQTFCLSTMVRDCRPLVSREEGCSVPMSQSSRAEDLSAAGRDPCPRSTETALGVVVPSGDNQ